jgi:Tfp pilus assembly protein PilF
LARITKRDFKTAREDLEAAIRMRPAEPDAWYFRAIVRGEEGDVEGAIEDCAKALSIAPKTWAYAAGAESLLAKARERKGPKQN